MKAVVMFSGGRGSWAAAKRAVARFGADEVTLLFADTKVEDEDTYRFLREAAENVGARMVVVQDGREPFDVFRDNRWLGNARLAHCSTELKVKPCREWIEANTDDSVAIVVGIDWSELHRLPAIENGWKPRLVWAPMVERPYLDGDAILDWMRSEGVQPPRAYADGFPHANCLAQGCVKGGIAYWSNLYHRRPEVFAATEQHEQEFRAFLGRDVSMLKERVDGESAPLTLSHLRERLEKQPALLIDGEWGGCGCFVDSDDAAGVTGGELL